MNADDSAAPVELDSAPAHLGSTNIYIYIYIERERYRYR